MLAETFVRVERAFPLVGVGGIDSGEAALEKIRAGATLIQLYTGFDLGIGLIADIKHHLLGDLRRQPPSLSDIVGTDAAARYASPGPLTFSYSRSSQFYKLHVELIWLLLQRCPTELRVCRVRNY